MPMVIAGLLTTLLAAGAVGHAQHGDWVLCALFAAVAVLCSKPFWRVWRFWLREGL